MFNKSKVYFLLTIYTLLKRDLEYYLLDIKSLVIFLTVFLSGLLVFLVSLKNMMGNSNNYFLFLLTGYLVVSYLNISGGAGFEIINDSYEGKLLYDRTLPIKRTEYAFVRIIGISLRGYVNFFICLTIMSPLLINFFTITKLAIFLVLSFFLSVIFTGLSILPIFLSKNLTIQSVIGSLLRSWFFLGSTIFYPFQVIPKQIQFIIILNPVTWVLELIRTLMNIPFATRFPMNISLLVIIIYLIMSVAGGMMVLLNYKNEN